jgi:hypothetical protein
VTATGPRLSAGLKAPDQRPSTGAIERYFYFSCCLLAGVGDRAAKGGVARRIGPQTPTSSIVADFRGGKGVSRRAYSPHGTKHSGCRWSRADCHGDHGHKPLGDNSRRTEQHCSHDKTKPLDGLNRRLLARCEVCFRLERLGTPAYVRGSKNALGTPTSSPSRLSTLRLAEARRSCATACGEFEGPGD